MYALHFIVSGSVAFIFLSHFGRQNDKRKKKYYLRYLIVEKYVNFKVLVDV